MKILSWFWNDGILYRIAFVAVVAIFDGCLLVLALVVIRGAKRSVKLLNEDMEWGWFILLIWFIVPFFGFFLFCLWLSGRLIITKHNPIPWKESKIFSFNHSIPKLPDTFFVPIVIFFSRLSNIFNPARYFPFTVADLKNYAEKTFFKIFAGGLFLVALFRRNGQKTEPELAGIEETSEKAVFLKCKKRLEGIKGSSAIFNIEGGRTQSAGGHIYSEKGSELGEPKKGLALLSHVTGAPVIPGWCRQVETPYFKYHLNVLVWKIIEWKFKKRWERLDFDKPRPIACPESALWGFLEMALKPGVRVYMDINHPDGPVQPVLPEAGREYARQRTKRIARAMLGIGDLQLERIEKGRHPEGKARLTHLLQRLIAN